MPSPLTPPNRLLAIGCLVVALTAVPAAGALAAPSEDDPRPPAPAPQLSLNPGSHDFGTVVLNRGGQQTGFWLDNSGPDWLPIQVDVTGPDASAFGAWDSCGGGVPQWSGCNVTAQFDPDGARDYAATLRVRSGDHSFTAELTGTGGLRQVTATPNPVDFGTVELGDSSTRSVTLQNTGNVFFQSMVAIPVGGDVGAFRLLEDGCSMRVLAPSVGCKLKLTFEPYEADNAEAALAVIGEGDPALVTLRGVGVEPPAEPVAHAPSAATTETAAAAASAKPAARTARPKTAKRPARVAFNWRRGLPAPFRGSRVDLGVARCVGAPTCRVSVRAWYVTAAAGLAAGTRTTSVRRATWWVGSGSPVALWIPQGLGGKPRRLIAELSTRAAGLPIRSQRLNVRLLEGIRRGGAVVAKG
jgi:hypothetical protein